VQGLAFNIQNSKLLRKFREARTNAVGDIVSMPIGHKSPSNPLNKTTIVRSQQDLGNFN